jgi:hypothetical protein
MMLKIKLKIILALLTQSHKLRIISLRQTLSLSKFVHVADDFCPDGFECRGEEGMGGLSCDFMSRGMYLLREILSLELLQFELAGCRMAGQSSNDMIDIVLECVLLVALLVLVLFALTEMVQQRQVGLLAYYCKGR